METIKRIMIGLGLFLLSAVTNAQTTPQPTTPPTTQPMDVAALSIARQVLTTGAAMVALGDYEGVAGQFTDDGELVTKSLKASGPPEIQVFRGSGQLLTWFKVVENLRGFTVVNNVEYARLVAPDLLYITGTLDLTGTDQQTTRLPFSQIRIQEGAAWKIINYQVIFPGG